MGRPAGWMKELTGRSAMRSPGAPSHRREVERLFWGEIAKGLLAEEAANAVGVSQAVGSRWFRNGGGMSPIDLAPLSGRYLSFQEREEIAILKAEGRVCARSPVVWDGRRPPSRGSCGVTRRRVTGSLTTALRLRSGRPSSSLGVPRPRSWSRTHGFASMCSSGCRGGFVTRTEPPSGGRRRRRGREGTSRIEAIGAGLHDPADALAHKAPAGRSALSRGPRAGSSNRGLAGLTTHLRDGDLVRASGEPCGRPRPSSRRTPDA